MQANSARIHLVWWSSWSDHEDPDPADCRNRACLQFRGRGFGSLRLGVRAALPRRFTSNQAAIGPRRQCTQQETTQIATVLLWCQRLRPLPPEAAAPARHARASGLPQVVLCCRGPTHALGSAPLPLACNLGSGGQVAETGSQDPIRHAEAGCAGLGQAKPVIAAVNPS